MYGGGYKKIIPVDSLLIVVSERSVLAFDRCGHYICNFGQRGNGEGEYIKVSTAYWDKSTRTLRVIDGIRNRALVYAQNGKLLDTLFSRLLLFLCWERQRVWAGIAFFVPITFITTKTW